MRQRSSYPKPFKAQVVQECLQLSTTIFAGYKASFEKGITEIGYMAHARRKFFDLHVANTSLLAEHLRSGDPRHPRKQLPRSDPNIEGKVWVPDRLD